jgi:hypothetical protein
MRLSKAQGEAKGACKCLSAKPDYMLSPATDRKVPTKWTMIVECSKDGATLDSPLMLVVDIAKEVVMTFEQAIQRAK